MSDSPARPEYAGKDLEAMSFARNYHRWILAEFLPYLRGSVAEVGAGTGSFSTLILETGVHRLTAFEPSRNMFDRLSLTLRGDARAATVHGLFAGRGAVEHYDAVVYVNVLEHVEDDAAELAGVRAALAPGGHLLLFVPALPWLYGDFDRRLGHFRRYTKRGLIGLVQQAGLSVVKAKYFDLPGIAPWYVNCVLLGNTLRGGSVALYDRLVVPLARRLERAVAPPIGKNVLLVARRTEGGTIA